MLWLWQSTGARKELVSRSCDRDRVYLLNRIELPIWSRELSDRSRLRAVDCLSSECDSVPRRVEALCLRRTRSANQTTVLPRH